MKIEYCHFCGSVEIGLSYVTCINGSRKYLVKCLTCGATGRAKSTEKKAVIAWNQRQMMKGEY